MVTIRQWQDRRIAERSISRVVTFAACAHYPLTHRATRIAAFVIAARLEAEREAAR